MRGQGGRKRIAAGNKEEIDAMGSSRTPGIIPLTGHCQEDGTDGFFVFQHQQAGDAAGAEKQFRAVVQRAPHDAKAHFSLGAIDDAAGRRRQAIEEYSTAVKDDPTLPDARLRLADALRTSGQLQASMGHYERAVDLDPRIADAWIGGAHALIDLGRYDQAREWLFRARRVHPERKELSDLEARLPPPRR